MQRFGPNGHLVFLEARAPDERLRAWLDQATALLGRSLDLDTTARRIVDLAVPDLADVAVLYGVDPETLQIGALTVAHADPE